MELTPKELMKQYVDSQKFNSTSEIMAAMKRHVPRRVATGHGSELDVELGYEKSEECQKC